MKKLQTILKTLPKLLKTPPWGTDRERVRERLGGGKGKQRERVTVMYSFFLRLLKIIVREVLLTKRGFCPKKYFCGGEIEVFFLAPNERRVIVLPSAITYYFAPSK